MENHSPCEVWKDIKGYEGKYQISNLGRLKSINGKFKVSCPDGFITLGTIDSVGYRKVSLRKSGQRVEYRIHALVANAFIQKRHSEKRLIVNHKDGNKLNNHVSNLEWVTDLENCQHAIKTGLTNNRGSNHGMSKLTEDQVILIRKLRSEGLLFKEIADKFGISRRQAGDISSGRNWGWLK